MGSFSRKKKFKPKHQIPEKMNILMVFFIIFGHVPVFCAKLLYFPFGYMVQAAIQVLIFFPFLLLFAILIFPIWALAEALMLVQATRVEFITFWDTFFKLFTIPMNIFFTGVNFIFKAFSPLVIAWNFVFEHIILIIEAIANVLTGQVGTFFTIAPRAQAQLDNIIDTLVEAALFIADLFVFVWEVVAAWAIGIWIAFINAMKIAIDAIVFASVVAFGAIAQILSDFANKLVDFFVFLFEVIFAGLEFIGDQIVVFFDIIKQGSAIAMEFIAQQFMFLINEVAVLGGAIFAALPSIFACFTNIGDCVCTELDIC
jgi:hypothetical protein